MKNEVGKANQIGLLFAHGCSRWSRLGQQLLPKMRFGIHKCTVFCLPVPLSVHRDDLALVLISLSPVFHSMFALEGHTRNC